MADDQPQLELTAAGVSPTASAPPVAPADPPVASPAEVISAEPPAAAESPPAEDPAVTAAQELATAQPTLLETLGADGQPVEPPAPAVDAPAVDPAAPPAEAAPVEPPPGLDPINYAELYELPATVTLNDDQRGQLHTALDTLRSGNHKDGIQALIGLHENALTAYSESEVERQHQAFADMRAGWREQLNSDPVFSGAGRQVALERAAEARNRFVSDHPMGTPEYAADLQAFNGLDHALGLGDHPVFLRFLHRVSSFINEPSIDRTPTEIGRPANPGVGSGNPLYDNDRSIALRNGRQ